MRRIRLARFLQTFFGLLPRQYPIKSKQGLIAVPFFILGSGRNGSTMLNRMLNQNTQLFLPPEQYFLGINIIKFKLYNYIIWRDLMKIFGGELLKATNSHTWDFDANEVIDDLFRLEDKSLQSVIDAVYRKYACKKKPGFKRWGDTTPMNTLYLPEIFSTFPEAKYIFLVRDARDVVASYKAGGVEYLTERANPENAARHWEFCVSRYDWLRKRTNVLEVRYEDLVKEPRQQLDSICKFLNVSYESQMMDFYKDEVSIPMYNEPQHRGLRKPVFTTSIGKWEQVLTADEQALVGKICKSFLRFNYL